MQEHEKTNRDIKPGYVEILERKVEIRNNAFCLSLVQHVYYFQVGCLQSLLIFANLNYPHSVYFVLFLIISRFYSILRQDPKTV